LNKVAASILARFSKFYRKTVIMEMRSDNHKKRRRIQRTPTLVRSVKPGSQSVQVWQKQTTSIANLWTNAPAA